MTRAAPAARILCLTLVLGAAATAGAFDAFDPEGEGPLYPPAANGRLAELPSIRALRIDGAPVALDGRLDDPVWRLAETGCGFVQFDPDRGGEPSEQTVFKVAYDDDALYFAVACYERDPALTSSCLARRDRIQNSDIVSVYLDPYHDRTTGYNFRVNPHGVLTDAYVFNDGERDWDWDAVWAAETHADGNGWYAELRIPFSSIRYRPAESMTWGLQVYRYMYGRGEDTAWVSWDREARGFVSRFGELTDLRGIRPPRQLEIAPYFVQRSTDPAAEGDDDAWDDVQNLGADIKYGVTADLTLNATVQPDFGQVEADPALLNLSPFETFFEEKRPFFIEGSRFFQHPDFNLFYSRRIGTGDENARIRYAAKLTGKTARGISLAGLVAATDVAGAGQAHNPFKGGDDRALYAVTRLGKEFADGAHRVNLMQTAVLRDQDSRWIDRGTEDEYVDWRRDAYATGLDFDLNFRDRMYNVRGSLVGTIVDPLPVTDDPAQGHETRYGTGGSLRLARLGGDWRGTLTGRWESDELDPNDLGYLRAPDETVASGWLQWRHDADGAENAAFNHGQVNLNWYQSWFYAGRRAADPDDPGGALWTYDRGHRQLGGWNVNSWWQDRRYREIWAGFWHDFAGADKYATRSHDGVRGPLMTVPEAYGAWLGLGSDSRRDLHLSLELNWRSSDVGSRSWNLWSRVRWIQSDRLSHVVQFQHQRTHADAQWLDNFAAEGGGIGGVSHVFGALDQRTWDITLRSSVLFSRDRSLELYVQPFLTVGDYADPRELARPDSYDLRPYAADGFDVRDRDFSYGAVNLNMVYRWEYRPGSTLFLVWTHSRSRYVERADLAAPDRFANDFGTMPLFRNEPENTFLVKMSYWFSL